MLLNRHKDKRQVVKSQTAEKQPVKPVEEDKQVKKSRK